MVAFTDAPQLPARRPSGPQGYENIPSKPPVSADASPERKRSSGVSSPPPSIGYENVPPPSGAVAPPPLPPRGFKTEAQNILPPDLHPRSYQNLPPRGRRNPFFPPRADDQDAFTCPYSFGIVALPSALRSAMFRPSRRPSCPETGTTTANVSWNPSLFVLAEILVTFVWFPHGNQNGMNAEWS